MKKIIFILATIGFVACQTKCPKECCGENACPQDSIAADVREWTLENCVNTLDSTKTVLPTKAGYQYWFVDKEFLNGRTLKLSVVAPGNATHPPHVHEEDEFFFVIEGKAKFYLNGDSTVVEPLTTLYCPPNVLHGIANAGDTELKYLVVKTYKTKE